MSQKSSYIRAQSVVLKVSSIYYSFVHLNRIGGEFIYVITGMIPLLRFDWDWQQHCMYVTWEAIPGSKDLPIQCTWRP